MKNLGEGNKCPSGGTNIIGYTIVLRISTLPHGPQESHGRLYWASEQAFQSIIDIYGRSLSIVLRHSFITLLILLGTIVVLNDIVIL